MLDGSLELLSTFDYGRLLFKGETPPFMISVSGITGRTGNPRVHAFINGLCPCLCLPLTRVISRLDTADFFECLLGSLRPAGTFSRPPVPPTRWPSIRQRFHHGFRHFIFFSFGFAIVIRVRRYYESNHAVFIFCCPPNLL